MILDLHNYNMLIRSYQVTIKFMLAINEDVSQYEEKLQEVQNLRAKLIAGEEEEKNNEMQKV